MILQGDCLYRLKELEDNSIDLVCTDPPYGYSFMGKDWDKAVPSVEIWQECLRVLKPGAFCFVMSAPRSDVQNAMISRLMEAGFRLDFTPIYWTYASGFPKAGNIGKLVDKRLGAAREVIGTANRGMSATAMKPDKGWNANSMIPELKITVASSPQAKALDGSYAGFQPKPAVEVIIVAMKPLSEKTFVDQALKNGKGITWLDDCRVPAEVGADLNGGAYRGTRDEFNGSTFNIGSTGNEFQQPQGRFPANLLVSDDVLNDGVERKTNPMGINNNAQSTGTFGVGTVTSKAQRHDTGSYSRYFDLDKWAQTLPFLIVPKASKSEKNKGLDNLNPVQSGSFDGNADTHNTNRKIGANPDRPNQPRANHHPTVKPLKLMSYLITLGSRPGDTVLDPFCGSGTTIVAAEQLDRKGIGIEREPEYVEIAEARVAHEQKQVKQESLL